MRNTISLSPRLLVLGLDLSMSFAILLLYANYFESLVLVLFLITASIVAANKDDFTAMRTESNLLIGMVVFAAIVFFAAAYVSSFTNGFLFYELIAINFGLLIMYVLLRFRTRGQMDSYGSFRSYGT